MTLSLRKNKIRYGIVGIAAAFVAAYLCSFFFIQVMLIQGDSMKPVLRDKQFVFIEKWTQNYGKGDIVAFRCEGLNSVLVKRIVATPGEEYFLAGERYVVPADCFFVLGDNREYSVDSRDERVGYVQKTAILGKVIMLF